MKEQNSGDEFKLRFEVEKMYKLPDAGNLVAFVDVKVNDLLVIHGCRVLKWKKGLFVNMPKEQGKDNKWYEQVSCLTPEVFDEFSKVVLEFYNQMG